MDKEQFDFIEQGMEKVYTLAMEIYDWSSTPRDYGSGEKMNMAEIHTLSLIADNPGITVSGVSKMWNRTLSAASQNIKKLSRKNLIEKRKEKGNNKEIHLYATESGRRLSDLHRAYDRARLSEIAEKLFEKHTFAELETALKTIETGMKIFAEI